jgi:hypothetical protein
VRHGPAGVRPHMDETPARPRNSVNSGAQCAGIGESYKHARAGSRSRVTVGARRGSRDRSSSSGWPSRRRCARRRDTSSQCRQRRMEHLWNPVVATRGNRWQIGRTSRRLRQANPLPWVATGCLSRSMQGGSRRFESVRGLCKVPANRAFLICSICIISSMHQVWSRL